MTLLDILKLRATDAPWYTRWWWWLLIAGAALLALIGVVASNRMAAKERERKFRRIEEITKTVAKNEVIVADAKEVLKKAAEDKKRIEEIDDEIEEVEERHTEMVDKINNATTLTELRALREEMIRREQ